MSLNCLDLASTKGTSPSKLEDTESFNDSLLASTNSGYFSEEVRKEIVDNGCVKMQPFSKCEKGNSSAVHPVRTVEEENVDYASNASSSSFEFHNERMVNNQFSRLLSSPMPCKQNDAEKWILKRQNVQPKYFKKNNVQNQTNRAPVTSRERVAPELLNHDPKSSNSRVAETKLVDFCQPASLMAFKNSLSLLLDLTSFLVQHMGAIRFVVDLDSNDMGKWESTVEGPSGEMDMVGVRQIIRCSCHKISLHEEYENRNDPCYKSSLLGLLHLLVQQLLSAAQLPQSHLLPKATGVLLFPRRGIPCNTLSLMSSVHIPRKGAKASSSLQNESAENRKITNASLMFATFLDLSYVLLFLIA
ncbi:hypothetical protein POTOM_040929 [Populus tomentosa]|uniref:Uncharacterized protein n=1 Tax=Populus tomentosa TaxID=118781 RepID=A0A8X7YS34_POPTO|nr:hypothetical protein POTOM_040929 [Populus tomentosa]